MRTKKVMRYYCDHCSKGWFQKPAAIRHEAVCFRRKDRTCPRCENAPEHKVQGPITERPKPIQTKAEECPDCLMAAVIRHNIGLDDEGKFHGEGISYELNQYRADRLDWDRQPFQFATEVRL